MGTELGFETSFLVSLALVDTTDSVTLDVNFGDGTTESVSTSISLIERIYSLKIVYAEKSFEDN